MRTWLFFALSSPLLWAIVHLLDAHCVEKVFDRPWMGVITGSLSSSLVFFLIPFFIPFMDWEIPGWPIVGLALLAGALIQFSQAFYFQALEHSEAGIVAAYWNMTPILLPIASYILFGQHLGAWHYMGMLGLVICSGVFCILDQDFNGRWRSFFFMLAACCIQVMVILLEKHIFEHSPFVVAFLLVTAGITISGFCPLLMTSVRKALKSKIYSKTVIAIIVGIEIINLMAILCSQQAIDHGTPSIVAAVETTIPAYTFLLSGLLLILMPQVADQRIRHKFYLKLLLVSLMTIGVGVIVNDP